MVLFPKPVYPAIKAWSRTPDAFKDQDLSTFDLWLGGVWKAMPGGPLAAGLDRALTISLDELTYL